MQVFVFVLLVFIGFAESAEKFELCELAKQTELLPKSLLDEALKKIVEDFRQKLKDGDPKNGIPSFDPFVAENIHWKPDLTLLNGTFKFERLEIQDVPAFDIVKAKVTGLLQYTIKLQLNFPSIKVMVTSYEGALDIFDMVHVFGAGDMGIDIKGFFVDINAKATLVGLKITKIDLKLRVPSIEAEITGLLNDEYMSAIISKQLSATLTRILQQEESKIEKLANCLAKGILIKKFKNVEDDGQCERNMENYWKQIREEGGGNIITECLAEMKYYDACPPISET